LKANIFFHYTSAHLSIGETLIAQDNGYCQQPENAAMEAILEDFRPNRCISRSDAVFLTKDPIDDGDKVGALGSDYELEVSVCKDTIHQRSDLNWLSEIDQEYESVGDIYNEFSEKEIQTIAEGYWSGKPYSDKPSYEFRALSAKITNITKKA
jgi:hypothetical protein